MGDSLQYIDMSRKDLIAEILRMKEHIREETEKCRTCKTVILAETEKGRRIRAAKVDTRKKDIIKLQRKGVFVPPGRRSKVVE
jgi:hypothetical protein